MKTFWTICAILAVLVGLASVAAVIYFGVFVMFIGGIIQIVNACKATDIQATQIAFGLARVFFTGISTVVVFWVLFLLNGAVWLAINEGFKSCRKWPTNIGRRNW